MSCEFHLMQVKCTQTSGKMHHRQCESCKEVDANVAGIANRLRNSRRSREADSKGLKMSGVNNITTYAYLRPRRQPRTERLLERPAGDSHG